MQVRITNVTDGPGQKPMEVRVYNKRLRPGAHMDVPIQFVDDKVRRLEQTGAIVIGKLPPWYSNFEAKRKVRNLTADEVTDNVKMKKDMQDKEALAVLHKEVARDVVIGVEPPKPPPMRPTDSSVVSVLPSEEATKQRNKR